MRIASSRAIVRTSREKARTPGRRWSTRSTSRSKISRYTWCAPRIGRSSAVSSKLTSVCEHYEPEAQSEYDTVQGRLLAIVTILENQRVEPDERWKVKSLGAVVVGEA